MKDFKGIVKVMNRIQTDNAMAKKKTETDIQTNNSTQKEQTIY